MSDDIVVALYGSRARGDADPRSDVDVMLAAESTDVDTAGVCEGLGLIEFATSVYTWRELEALHADGSLFLLHLALEGRLLGARGLGAERFDAVISDLPRYAHVDRDLTGFATALSDVRNELSDSDSSIDFELSIAATVMRHASILGCYLLGAPSFGRYTAVKRFCLSTDLPSSLVDAFVSLYEFRLAQDGRSPFPPTPERAMMDGWLSGVTMLLEEVSAVAERSRS
jgi:hypothetical protein